MRFWDGQEPKVEESTGQAAVGVWRAVVVVIVLSVVECCAVGNAAVVVDRSVVDTMVLNVFEISVLRSTAVVSGKWVVEVCEMLDTDRSLECEVIGGVVKGTSLIMTTLVVGRGVEVVCCKILKL